MKRKTIVWVLLVICAGFLCSCSAQSSDNSLKAEYTVMSQPTDGLDTTQVGDPAALIDNVTPYTELITEELDIHTFAQAYGANSKYFHHSTIQEVAAHIGIECLRYTEDGTLYSVHQVKQGGLVYIFYHADSYNETGDMSGVKMNRWFYVREQMSTEDFRELSPDEDTLESVIEIDPGVQIFDNIYAADPELNAIDFVSWHYLKDGIYYIQYKTVDGKRLVADTHTEADFELVDHSYEIYTSSNARILDMDWPL